MVSASSGLLPAVTACPTARSSLAISLPCRAIHTLCQVSMTTATPRIAALNSSWPMPSNSRDRTPAKAATRQAAAMPPSTAPPIQPLRCRTDPVTASTMPTIRPASKTSRKTMMGAASTGKVRLLYGQGAARPFVEVFVELVAPGFERAHIDDAVAVGGHHFLDPQRLAFDL